MEKTKNSELSVRACREKYFIKRRGPPRSVPAFTYQSLQKNTIVIPPQKVNVYKRQPVRGTFFRTYFLRGDIPVFNSGKAPTMKKGTMDYGLRWSCDPMSMDYCYYLPIFIDGLAESRPDLRLLAERGAMDLIQRAPSRLLPVLPKMILPMKRAFNTRDKKVILGALKVLQLMVSKGPCVGQALVPYYRQLLTMINLFKHVNVNLGDGVDPDRTRRIGDVIEDTLKLLELCGGPNSFINIKYMIPTYESILYPLCEHEEEK